MTNEILDNTQTDNFEQAEYNKLIDFFWERYNNRYFNPIKALQNHSDISVRNNCGFIIATIDCILIETLEQYYTGNDESNGKNHEPFFSFFNRTGLFSDVIKTEGEAGKFTGLVRSGLIHQSKTKKESIINKKHSTPILDWVDVENKNKGFVLNRDKFHKVVIDAYINYIEEIKKPESRQLRINFICKLKTLID